MIEVIEVPLADIPQMIVRGEIDHALIMNAFFFLMLQEDSGRTLLESRLKEFTRP